MRDVVDEKSAAPVAETVYYHALDSKRRLVTVRGVLVEQAAHSLTVQHSSGDQHTYASAYDLNDLKVGNHFRAFAYRRPGLDEYERLFPLPEVCHEDGTPETPFDADRHAVELFEDGQTADVAATARAAGVDLLGEEERLKDEVVATLQSLQAAGKVAADYVQDVGRLFGMPSTTPDPQVLAPGGKPASVNVVQRVPVTFSRRPLPARAEILASMPASKISPEPASLPRDRGMLGKKEKQGKKLSRSQKKKLAKKTGWLNP